MNLLEDNHWWYVARRKLIEPYLFKGKILEVGCGTGGNIRYFKKKGIRIQGVDISGDVGATIVADAEKLPFENNYFDQVLILDVLEHVTDDKKALKEALRVVKPGGLVIITVPNYKWMWSKWDEELGHKRRYEVKQLIKLIDDIGFIRKDMFCYFSFLLVSVYIYRKIKEKINKEIYNSDFKENIFGLGLLANVERMMIKLGFRPPFGLSSMWILTKK
jgi:ubiquinone/menaquinone biosynthesis C-methylase UbiE